jgi:hypothetical protein
MGGRGPQSFKKRQKEQARKEKQQEKIAKRLEKNRLGPNPEGGDVDADADDQTEEYGPVVIEGDDFPGSLIRPHTDSR